jgi:hypothetical protein
MIEPEAKMAVRAVHLMRSYSLSLTNACTCLWLAATMLLTGCYRSAAPEPGLLKLAERFKIANQASNIQPMLELYCLNGSDKLIISRLKGALDYELGLPIQGIEFEPLSGAAEEQIEFTHDGITYGPSLKPRYRMRVIYAVEEHFTSLFTVGQHASGEWQIICAKPKAALPLNY